MVGAAFDVNQFMTTLVTVVPVAVGFVWAIKSDTKVLRQRLDTMDHRLEIVDKRLTKIDDVLVDIAKTNGRLDRLDDRIAATNARNDELSRRFNEYVDSRDSNNCPAVRR